MSSEVQTVCLVPECDSEAIHLRGLCRPCYTYAASLVLHGLSSWDQLEASGCVGSADGRVFTPTRQRRVEWFADGIGVTPESLILLLKDKLRSYRKRTRKGAA